MNRMNVFMKDVSKGASLVAQWQRIHLPMQEMGSIPGP